MQDGPVVEECKNIPKVLKFVKTPMLSNKLYDGSIDFEWPPLSMEKDFPQNVHLKSVTTWTYNMH